MKQNKLNMKNPPIDEREFASLIQERSRITNKKHKLLMIIATLCAVMTLNSCSNEQTDDEPTTIIVETWTQDDDDNILVINTNGIVYETLTDHTDNRKRHSISVSISF